jgi:hypothetical protein
MSPAYELNPNPEIPCTCGPNLLCLHGATAPTDPARDHPGAVPANPAGNHKKS